MVWRRAHALTLDVYRVVRLKGRREHAALINQARRAAMSIPAKIAEKCARATQRDFRKFLNISYASAAELEYHLILARDLGLLGASEFRSLTDQVAQVRMMLAGLLKRVSQGGDGPARRRGHVAVADG
ncbi:MAG: four helix bundle protein [Gemmatimonadota bacterium]|nr:four helix bundle protein [Gemmatimonadota bacterium]